MVSKASIRAAGAAALLGLAISGLAGCSALSFTGRGESQPSAAACRCPPPVHYGDADIKAISAALRALPQNNPLQQAMSDYENERDNLRICLGR